MPEREGRWRSQPTFGQAYCCTCSAEALMFTINKESETLGIPLKDLRLRQDVIIACIIRDSQIIYPTGADSIQCGDQVLVVTTSKLFDDIDDILEAR